MSNYRDDTQETLVVSDKTFGGLRAVVDEVMRLSDGLLFGIAITLSSSAIASDEVIDTTSYAFTDSAVISDEVLDQKQSTQLITDSAKVSDYHQHNLLAISTDSITISDTLLASTIQSTIADSATVSDNATGQRIATSLISDSVTLSDMVTALTTELIADSAGVSEAVIDTLRATNTISDSATVGDTVSGSVISLSTDSARLHDQVIATRHVNSQVIDSATASDSLPYNQSELISDSLTLSDNATGVLHAYATVIDVATITDSVLDVVIQNTVITDSAMISDDIIDSLNVTVLITDSAVIEDITIDSGGLQGQAWTANVDSWAMSRYNPYNYDRLVVIDGVLYGEADDGIYQLNQEVYPVVASVKTGKMDLGGGQLTHPNAAYLEYELTGQASMTVHTTQKGVEQQYTYVLPNELADELTNGRFIFGRGLRGRHFSFELTMVGTHGYINDLSVEHQPTSRRV